MFTLNRFPILVFILLLPLHFVTAQQILTLDVVSVNAAYEKEAMFFYNENWKTYRIETLRHGFISGFEMLRTKTDSTNHFELILITVYPDSAAFNNREENFRPIMKRISPGGPKMLNSIPRKEFLENVAGYDTFWVTGARSTKKE